MKLRRLDLLRYGHLADVPLVFADSTKLQVVYGLNEAGKSTALAAIADALFGFGHRTDFDFLHGAPQLRVGFSLAASDGTQATFVRRKGRRDTLRDADDQPVPETALLPFLGGISRDLFERGFGLDGARLRQGGQDLLRGGGEAGESLLAGAGLLNLRGAANRLEEEAKSLSGDGRGRRKLAVAVDAWRQATREAEERAVAPRAWQETMAALTQATVDLQGAQSTAQALAAEANRLQRIRRVAPLLAALDAAQATVADVADAPHFPAHAEARLEAVLTTIRDAGRDAAREVVEARRLAAERDALPQDAAILAVQDAIDALAERRAVAVRAAADLPGVATQVAVHREQVVAALTDLGLAQPPEAARDAVPPATARRAAQLLINRHGGLTAAAEAATRALREAEQRRTLAAAALDGMPEPPSPALLRRAIDAVRGQGPLDDELVRAEGALADAARIAESALSALPLWQDGMAALTACKLPLPADAAAAAARLTATASAREDARAAADGLTGEIEAAEAAVARLGRGETVPTPAVVGAAREARDAVWRVVRRMHEGGTPPDADERAALPAAPLPDAFETLRDDADRLADRRADDAQRVADFLSAQAYRALLRDRLVTAQTVSAEAVRADEAAGADWLALWAPSGLMPGTPAAMTEWRRARDDVLRLAEAADSARRRHDDLTVRRDRACADLAPLVPGAAEDATLAALLLRAETACAAAEAAAAAHAARVAALAHEQNRLAALQQSVRDAEAALADWRDVWATALAPLGLPPDAAPAEAEAALHAWQRIAETASAWRTDEQRVGDMTRTVADFAEAVHAVLMRLGHTAGDEPAPAVAARLARTLADARKAAGIAADLDSRIAAHEGAMADAVRRRQDAAADLAALHTLAGTADDDALTHAIARARRRDAAAAAVVDRGADLLAQGDGLAEAALREEVAAVSVDGAVARLTEIDAERTALDTHRERMAAARTTAETALAAMRAGQDAAAKAQEAADALAEARACAERYARLHVARVLLQAGIARFRRDEQGPLLRAAGAHFALLTGGRYRRLSVDAEPDGPAMLLVVRDDSSECRVEALSEGTRDQLYLALRVAAIEAHAGRAEPIPFIADDLLVNFDDPRATAALALLAQLGETTQVILFTHHEHIMTLAGNQPGATVQRLPGLPTARVEPVANQAAN